MINIKTVENAYLYTYGAWTSQTLTNSLSGFVSGVSTEWGYLSWTEENTGTGYTGEVRIDVLNASDDSVLIADIAKNSDGSATDISTYASTNNIKIRVKLYGIDYPTPKVSNIWIKYKNWIGTQIVTINGKNVLLNRSYLSSPTVSEINRAVIGENQTSTITESSSNLDDPVSSDLAFNSVTFDTTNLCFTAETYLDETDTQVANGTVMNAIGFKNTDTTPIFCAGVRFTDITKDSLYRYYIRTTFKISGSTSSTYVMTNDGKLMFLNRCFYASPTYNEINRYYLGYTSSLSSTMSALDTTHIGPAGFTYTLHDSSAAKLVFRSTLAKDEGNSLQFNAVGHANDETTERFLYCGKLSSLINKTASYIYLFTVNYLVGSPSSGSL